MDDAAAVWGQCGPCSGAGAGDRTVIPGPGPTAHGAMKTPASGGWNRLRCAVYRPVGAMSKPLNPEPRTSCKAAR